MKINVGQLNLILELGQREILMLLVLVTLTAASFWYMKKLRKDRVTRLGNYETLKEVHNKRSVGSPVILIAKILVVTVLFLTATESVHLEAQQPVTDVNYVVAVDSSNTMLMPDYEPDRFGYAQERLVSWIENLGVRADISVMKYSSQVTTISLPTKDTEKTVNALSKSQVNLNATGTDISNAIEEASKLGKDTSKKRILLVTDGSGVREEDIRDAKKVVKNSSFRIYVFNIPRNNRTDQMYEQLNLSLAEAGIKESPSVESYEEGLRELAEASGGEHYSVDDGEFFHAALDDTTTKEKRVGIDSSFYILIFLSFFVIFEMLLYSKYGAL